MATLAGSLWEYNFARIVVLDVTDDYRFRQPPLPSACYPVLRELWMPIERLDDQLPSLELVDGYLYDWHELPEDGAGTWFVGVVSESLLPASMVIPS